MGQFGKKWKKVVHLDEPQFIISIRELQVQQDMPSKMYLLVDNRLIKHVRTCTEAEGLRMLGTNWKLTAAKFDAFIALSYARGTYQAKNFNILYLWNKNWGPQFFAKL